MLRSSLSSALLKRKVQQPALPFVSFSQSRIAECLPLYEYLQRKSEGRSRVQPSEWGLINCDDIREVSILYTGYYINLRQQLTTKLSVSTVDHKIGGTPPTVGLAMACRQHSCYYYIHVTHLVHVGTNQREGPHRTPGRKNGPSMVMVAEQS